MTKVRLILGKEFIDWLYKMGIVPYWTQSVTIHASLNEVVTIRVDQVGTTALIGLDVPPIQLACPWCGSGVHAVDMRCKSCGGSTVVGTG